MSNPEAGPGPATARIKLNLSRPPAPAPTQASVSEQTLSTDGAWQSKSDSYSQQSAPPSTALNMFDSDPAGSFSHSTPAPRPDETGNHEATSEGIRSTGPQQARGRGRGSRPRGGTSKGSRLEVRRSNPTRHAGMKANGRIQQSSLISEEVSSRGLKLNFNQAKGTISLARNGGRKTSFLGDYDRDLDENPQEPLVFEEQFILRVPEAMAGNLKEMVKGKSKGLEGVEIKFLDSRRAAFRLDGQIYGSKLVDLPNIIEAQKTYDSRHLFKVADISQMLVVEDSTVDHEADITSSALNVDDYVWPHGLTPPLRHVRKRRFRKRVSRRAIEVVEEQVEELMRKDEDAEESFTDLIDANPNPDAPDSYYIDYDPDAIWYQQDTNESEFDGSEVYEDPGSSQPRGEWDDQVYGDEDDGEGEFDEAEEAEDEYDDDLAAALREEMKVGSEDEGDSDAGDLSGEDEDEEGARSGDDEEDEEAAERKAKIKQYIGEIKVLEATIDKKKSAFTGGNPIMLKRFEETIAGLQADINTKVAARQALQNELDAMAVAKMPPVLPVDAAQSSSANLLTTTPQPGTSQPDGRSDNLARDDSQGPDVSFSGTPVKEASDGSDEDDLFGDGDDEDGDAAQDTPAAQGDISMRSEDNEDEASEDIDNDNDEAIDEEMAALLNAELEATGNEPEAAQITVGQPLTSTYSAPQLDLEDSQGPDPGTEIPGTSAPNVMGVEGGVGMRRLATGHFEDADDGDSDSTGSSYE